MSECLSVDALAAEHSNGAVAMIKMVGDSMTPFLNDGDAAIVTKVESKGYLEGTIYAVRHRGETYIRRVQWNRKTGAVRLLSDNPKYETMIIEGDNLKSFEVIGRVVGRLGGVQ